MSIGRIKGLLSWTRDFTAAKSRGGKPTTQRSAHVARARERGSANIAWLRRTFALAARERAAGIGLFLHADMWSPVGRVDGGRMEGHQTFIEALAPLVETFGRPVLIVSGDSHDFRVDAPVEWFELYGLASPEDLTQIVVDRSMENDITWLRLSVDPADPAVFRWEEVVVP